MPASPAPRAIGYVAGISWPRSGHHLMVRLLQAYFGAGFGYCEFHMARDCCKAFPCARAGQVNLSKNHDFRQATPQLDTLRYLIQFRAFAPSVVSSYELSLGKGGEDTPEAFRKYVSQRWGPYQMFLEKWIFSDFGKRHVILRYEELTADPVAAMRPVAELFAPGAGFDAARMQDAARTVTGVSLYKGERDYAAEAGVRNRRRLEAFRHYDPSLFSVMERLMLHRRPVLQRWRAIRGSAPLDEDTILRLQTLPDLDALDAELARDR